MNLPAHVPVMPLPNAILFPGVLLPLHIFESRYRQMLEDALQGDRMFCVALRRANGQPHPVAGVGLVRTSTLQSDGTSNLILEGVARVRIEEYLQLKPYRVARVTERASFTETAPVRDDLLVAVRRLAQARARFGTELPKSMLDSLLAVEDPGALSDLVSYTLLDNWKHKQLLLETLEVHERVARLVEFLRQETRQFDLWRQLQGNLPTDHVGRN